MIRGCFGAAAILILVLATGVPSANTQSDNPMVDKVADKVIEKYKNTSCAELKAQKESPQPPSAQQAQMTKKAVEMLKKDPKMREQFLNKVAPAIANKMFECGLIP